MNSIEEAVTQLTDIVNAQNRQIGALLARLETVETILAQEVVKVEELGRTCLRLAEQHRELARLEVEKCAQHTKPKPEVN
jgi:capsule polysaccharide export protein KpsE/RkpR